MSFETELKQRAQSWATSITKKAKLYLGNKERLIRISSKTETDNSGKIIIVTTASNTTVSEYGDLKRVARAYEYGSGIHSKRGSRKYIIAPRRKKVLAFYWDKVDSSTPAGAKFRGISATTGKALFNYVEHPGVAAANGGRGYIKPAINDVRKQIRKDVPAEIRKELIGNFRRAFKQ